MIEIMNHSDKDTELKKCFPCGDFFQQKGTYNNQGGINNGLDQDIVLSSRNFHAASSVCDEDTAVKKLDDPWIQNDKGTSLNELHVNASYNSPNDVEDKLCDLIFEIFCNPIHEVHNSSDIALLGNFSVRHCSGGENPNGSNGNRTSTSSRNNQGNGTRNYNSATSQFYWQSSTGGNGGNDNSRLDKSRYEYIVSNEKNDLHSKSLKNAASATNEKNTNDPGTGENIPLPSLLHPDTHSSLGKEDCYRCIGKITKLVNEAKWDLGAIKAEASKLAACLFECLKNSDSGHCQSCVIITKYLNHTSSCSETYCKNCQIVMEIIRAHVNQCIVLRKECMLPLCVDLRKLVTNSSNLKQFYSVASRKIIVRNLMYWKLKNETSHYEERDSILSHAHGDGQSTNLFLAQFRSSLAPVRQSLAAPVRQSLPVPVRQSLAAPVRQSPAVPVISSLGYQLRLRPLDYSLPGRDEVKYGGITLLVLFLRRNILNFDLTSDGEGKTSGVILDKYKQDFVIKDSCYRPSIEYAELKQLGSGMSGSCFLMEDTSSKKRACFKEVPRDKFKHSEVTNLLMCDHEHIVKVYGVILSKHNVYIIMEWIKGGSLEDLIRGYPRQNSVNGPFQSCLPEGWCLEVIRTLFLLLEYLSQPHMRILHEDIKASNIMINEDSGSVVLVDFGLSHHLTGGEKGVAREIDPVGAQVNYSPEKAASLGHSFPSEVWAMACTLYHMFVGEFPWLFRYKGLSALHYIIKKKSPPKEDIPYGMKNSLRELLLFLWHPIENKRPTAAEAVSYIDDLLINGEFEDSTSIISSNVNFFETVESRNIFKPVPMLPEVSPDCEQGTPVAVVNPPENAVIRSEISRDNRAIIANRSGPLPREGEQIGIGARRKMHVLPINLRDDSVKRPGTLNNIPLPEQVQNHAASRSQPKVDQIEIENRKQHSDSFELEDATAGKPLPIDTTSSTSATTVSSDDEKQLLPDFHALIPVQHVDKNPADHCSEDDIFDSFLKKTSVASMLSSFDSKPDGSLSPTTNWIQNPSFRVDFLDMLTQKLLVRVKATTWREAILECASHKIHGLNYPRFVACCGDQLVDINDEIPHALNFVTAYIRKPMESDEWFIENNELKYMCDT